MAWAVVASTALSYLLVGVTAMRTIGVDLRDWLRAHAHGLACGTLAVALLWPLTLTLHRVHAPHAVVLAAALVASGAAALAAVRFAPKVFLGDAGGRILRIMTESGWNRWLKRR